MDGRGLPAPNRKETIQSIQTSMNPVVDCAEEPWILLVEEDAYEPGLQHAVHRSSLSAASPRPCGLRCPGESARDIFQPRGDQHGAAP